MSIFYLLPHRAILGDYLADCLGALLPGLDWTIADRRRLVEWFTERLVQHEEVFLVSRDDLPAGGSPEQVLRDGFGATAGDEVIELFRSGMSGEFRSRRFRIGEGNDQRHAA